MEILPLVSFLTGAVSILSPCILPVIPIFLAFSLAVKSKKEIISFFSGFGSIFLIIVIFTAIFTNLVYRYAVYVRIISAVVLLAVGVMMMADYSPDFTVKLSKNRNGVLESFLFGFITSLSWAPCYGAYLIALIALLAGTGSAYAVFNILLYVLGFALALGVLSFLVSKINLENLISKTRIVPKIFAVLIIIAALYLFWESLKVLI